MKLMKPSHYELTIIPDFHTWKFTGRETIRFSTEGKTDGISFDSVGLKIESCVIDVSGSDIVKSWTTDDNEEKLIITLKKPLDAGTYELRLVYQGEITGHLRGLYKSKYEHGGTNGFVLSTQFEPTDAHRAFVCIDHPFYKAIFDVSFVIPEQYTGVSNMLPRSETSVGKGLKKIRFHSTPLMSTYLLYFGIGPWEIEERQTSYGLLVRGISTPGKSQYTRFALEVADKCVKYFAEYFDFPYPFQKLDLLAVPDFAAGAMENWGAITFREIILLLYPTKTSRSIRERIAEVVCHEIAHQWFGNLVTMEWFDDIWLNESFATYMAYKAMDRIFPEWDNWKNYVRDTVFSGMALDSLRSTHPIHAELKNSKQIDELFDEISYEKGGSVLRMIEGYLGENNFRRALRNYIRRYSYKNTKARDLWDEFEAVSDGFNIRLIEKYIMQPGFPLVSASLHDDTLRLVQKRFLLTGEDDRALTWDIPVVLQNGRQTKRLILSRRRQDFTLSDFSGISDINNNYSGFYISNYEPSLFSVISRNSRDNNAFARIGFVHDLWNLVLNGTRNLDEFLSYVKEREGEKDPFVSGYMLAKLLRIYSLTENREAKRLFISMAQKTLEAYGYEPENEESLHIIHARNTAIYGLVSMGDQKVSEYVLKSFSQYAAKKAPIHKDMKSVVFSSAVWIDDKNYAIVKRLFEKSTHAETRVKLLAALANSKKPERIKQTLEFVLTGAVRLTDYFYPVLSTSQNPFGRKIAYDWLVKEWDRIINKLGFVKITYMRRTLKFIVPDCAIGKEKEINEFLHSHIIPGLEKTYDQVLEELGVYSVFVGRYNKK